MRPETTEWVAKAEGDHRTLERELAAPDTVYDSVCFHAQQCAEKYLKAILVEHSIPFPKTHDLTRIAGLLPAEDAFPAEMLAKLPLLTACAVEFRYAGGTSTPGLAEEAAQTSRLIRSFARHRLGLPEF